MTSNESKNMMEKLQALMAAAEDFKGQSEQLSAARGDFDTYLKAVVETDEKMSALISRCESYISEAQSLICVDLSKKIDNVADRAATTFQTLLNRCEISGSELIKFADDLTGIVSEMRSHRDKLEVLVQAAQGSVSAAVKRLEDHTDDRFGAVRSELSVAIATSQSSIRNDLTLQSEQYHNDHKQIHEEIQSAIDAVNETQGCIRKFSESLQVELDTKYSAFIEAEKVSEGRISEKIDRLLDGLSLLAEQQRKNGMLVKIAIGVGGLSAILSFINLLL